MESPKAIPQGDGERERTESTVRGGQAVWLFSRKRCVKRLLTGRLGVGHRGRNQKVMASMTSVVDQAA